MCQNLSFPLRQPSADENVGFKDLIVPKYVSSFASAFFIVGSFSNKTQTSLKTQLLFHVSRAF